MSNLLRAAAGFCTTRTTDPYWNESAWFSLSLPERGIHGEVRFHGAQLDVGSNARTRQPLPPSPGTAFERLRERFGSP